MMTSNYNTILSVLDTINKEANVSVYVPSLKREVKFKNINTGQQKALLKAAVDNPVFQTRFTIALYNIISENCTEPEIVKELTTVDSAAIAVQLRIATTGTQHVIAQNGKKYTIDLAPVVERFKSFEALDPEVISAAPFSVNVDMPLLVEQYNLEKQLREKSLNDQQIVSAQLTDTIGDAFVGEVSKVIREITVFHNNVETVLDYKSLPYVKRHAVLEKLPSTLIKTVLKYMEKYVGKQKDILTVTGIDVETGETANDLILLVDAALFVIT
jgi:hypothetical protein